MGVRDLLNQPGRTAYIESSSGKVRDECLNRHGFETLRQARIETAPSRIDYNEIRPHRSCGRIPRHALRRGIGSKPPMSR